jgi:hypothetical protein
VLQATSAKLAGLLGAAEAELAEVEKYENQQKARQLMQHIVFQVAVGSAAIVTRPVDSNRDSPCETNTAGR